MKNEKAELIEKWLREGSDDAKNIIDLPWKIEKTIDQESGAISLVATHLRFPLPIIFRVDDYNTTVIVNLGVGTDSMDVRDRMEIYRDLLRINTQIPYAKIGLVGDDLDVVIYEEIETCLVQHDILNNYMEILINGLFNVAKTLGLEQELVQLTIDNIVSFIENKKNAGMSREEIEKYLMKKLAIPFQSAKQLVDQVYKDSEKSSTPDDIYV
ncbi:MAG: hypothetical protein GXO25_00495 [Euryarchaeota archaeon]|nr:hypothetical protein [Euryarchaeota archaeon]